MFNLDPAALVLAILLASLALFVTDAVRFELVAIGMVLALVLTGVLEPDDAFAGFSSPAIVLIASMYVFGHAFTRSGLAEALGRAVVARSRGGSEARLVARVTAVSGILSSVLSNTGVVAALIPVCNDVGRRLRIPLSRLLMPMAFGSLVGGLMTVIATSTNIAINEELRTEPGGPFGLFEFTHLGALLLVVTVAYFLGPGRWLLPRSNVDETLTDRYQVPKFVTEVLVSPSSTLINRAVADADVFQRHRITVLGIVRAGGESPVMAPGPYNRIRAEDTLILQGSPEDLVRFTDEIPVETRASVEAGGTRLYSDDVQLVEAVVPASSEYAGQSLKRSELRSRTNLNVLAVAHHGELRQRRLQDSVLEVGDTLLVQGHVRDIERVKRERQLLILDEVALPRPGRMGWITAVTLLVVLLSAAFTSQSLAVLGLLGAMALVVFGVVKSEEVSRCIDWSVIAMVGGMLALGQAFERHGLSHEVAEALGSWTQGAGPTTALAVVLIATVLLTQVLNNVATALIMTPVALDLARSLDVSARPLLMAVMTGASLAFLSPVAHQANLMVLGPGKYRYRDFVRVGLPLSVVTIAVAVFAIPVFWPF